MRELIVVRHGQTEWNLAGRVQGTNDSPLTALGREQARDHAARLGALLPPPERIICSPLGRARDTAALIALPLRCPVEYHDALRERSVGALEGRTHAWVAVHEPAIHAEKRARPWLWRPPGGESLADVALRLRPFLDDLLSRRFQRLVLVTHSALARPLFGALLALSPEEAADVDMPNEIAYGFDLTAPSITVREIGPDGERSGWRSGALSRTLNYDPLSRPAPCGDDAPTDQ